MISRYTNLVLYFWNKHVKESREVAMTRVVAILPLTFSTIEFVDLKKNDPQAQAKYLNKTYKMLNQAILSGDLKVAEDVSDIKRHMQPATETWVTFYVPVDSLNTVDNSLVIKKDTQITISQIQSFTLSGSQIDDWNYRNYKGADRLSRQQLNEHFTYPAKDFKEPSKVADYKKPQKPQTGF